MSLKVGDIVELDIERLATGGDGVGRTSGFVVFVPYTAPQEKVKVRITQIKKSFATAAPLQIITPGPERTEAPCDIFGICGGCTWQHVTYEEQLRQKQMIVEFPLQKISPTTKASPIWPSPSPWYYRGRVQMHIEGGKLGYLKRGSHDFVEAKHCWIADKKIVDKFGDIKAKYAKVAGRIKVEIGVNDDGKIYDIRTDTGATAFTQVNRPQNEKMIAFVLNEVKDSSLTRVFDFYCGQGNFSFPIAEAFSKIEVTGVEQNPVSIARAREMNSVKNHTNLQFFCGETAEFLSREKDLSNSLIVLDPPRAGCDPLVIEALNTHRPKKIIYISCDPHTFYRDAKDLIGGGGYELKVVQPLDMFPQTDHIELIGVFESGLGALRGNVVR